MYVTRPYFVTEERSANGHITHIDLKISMYQQFMTCILALIFTESSRFATPLDKQYYISLRFGSVLRFRGMTCILGLILAFLVSCLHVRYRDRLCYLNLNAMPIYKGAYCHISSATRSVKNAPGVPTSLRLSGIRHSGSSKEHRVSWKLQVRFSVCSLLRPAPFSAQVDQQQYTLIEQ